MAIIRKSAPAATSAPTAPGTSLSPVPAGAGAPQTQTAAQSAGGSKLTDFSKVGAEALTYWLFNAPADQHEETARAHEFVRVRRLELEKVLHDATEKTERVLAAGFLAGAKPEVVRKRAEELVTIAVAELRRPLREPQMVDLLLATPASLEAAFLKLASFNIPVCSSANLARFTVRKNNGILIVQPQPEIGGLFDAAQGVVARMEGTPNGAAPKFSVSAHAVREQDYFVRTTTEEREGVEYRPNDRPDTTKPNAYIGAFAVIRAGSQLPLIAYLTEAVLATRTQSGKLGQNTFYAKAPERELTNIVTREALRRFLLERANSFIHRLAEFELGVQTMFEDDHGAAPTPGQHAAKFAVAVEKMEQPEPAAQTPGFSFGKLFVQEAGPTRPASEQARPSAPAVETPAPADTPGGTSAPASASAPSLNVAPESTAPIEGAPRAARRPRRQPEAEASPAAQPSSSSAGPSAPIAPPAAPAAAPAAAPSPIRAASPQDEEELALT